MGGGIGNGEGEFEMCARVVREGLYKMGRKYMIRDV